jgi:lipopolysaccharide transport system permease protein
MRQHYMEIIWYKALAELRAEAARAYIGFFWWIIEPVLYMAAFYVVFGLIFSRGGQDFVPFLLCGLVVWKWFSSTVLSCANSIPGNAALMQQVYMPKHLLPATVLVVNTLKFFLIFAMLLVFLIIYGYSPSATWLALPLLIMVQMLFIAAVGGLLAAVIPFVPDLRLILDNALLLLLFLSGIFFDPTAIPANLRLVMQLNPIALIIEGYRAVLLRGQWPDLGQLGAITLLSLLGIGIALRLISRYDRVYPKVLV